jgi:hypothetical protein
MIQATYARAHFYEGRTKKPENGSGEEPFSVNRRSVPPTVSCRRLRPNSIIEMNVESHRHRTAIEL